MAESARLQVVSRDRFYQDSAHAVADQEDIGVLGVQVPQVAAELPGPGLEIAHLGEQSSQPAAVVVDADVDGRAVGAREEPLRQLAPCLIAAAAKPVYQDDQRP